MPPASSTVSHSSKSKNNHLPASSPDSEPSLPPPDTQPSVAGKKKKKNASSKQIQNTSYNDRVSSLEILRGASPPTTQTQTILSQIPHGFSSTEREGSLLLDVRDEDINAPERVSDQYTPPNDVWLVDNASDKSPPFGQAIKMSRAASPVQPGFSTKTRHDVRSPPASPASRYARPVSYSGGTPSGAAIPRISPSAYTYVPSAYGSPPAPHLPQQHFYHAQDVNLNVGRANAPYFKEDPTLAVFARLPPAYSISGQGVLMGYEGRLSLLRWDSGGLVDEIGVIEGLSGRVIDAVMLEWSGGLDPFAAMRPLIAITIHGPKESNHSLDAEGTNDDFKPTVRQGVAQPMMEYTTKVEIYSLSTQEQVCTLLETPGQVAQSTFRGAAATPPKPIGNLRTQATGCFLSITSGTSGEVYVFTVAQSSPPGFECIGKFWTAIQPQVQPRDASRHQSSDADISPADLGRANGSTERAISAISGRWLAISPAPSPSRSTLGATIGPRVQYGRHTGVETTSAPAQPSVTCEVDSPDADTLFGKVARGVAQELVKGARWLGDQGYQTWQNYWKKDSSPSLPSTQPQFSPPIYPTTYMQGAFPPTHGDSLRSTKEPELVAIYDLQILRGVAARNGADEAKPLATFQPPRGCSYISFGPHGLNLLTSSRKGDVQYVWDLMQIKHCRTQVAVSEDERTRHQPRVRQIAKYERLSGSTIVDVVWDFVSGTRFAILTKNNTVHLFDLPQSASRWPPPRTVKKVMQPKPKSADGRQPEGPISSGFFASAINIANQAQPMIANWRGRTPSMGGGLAGIGQTGIGLASATGARGSKVVAAGLSKSLGAASETVHHIRHAGESRLHLKPGKELRPGKIFWLRHGRKVFLAVVESDSIKQYQVRRNIIPDRRDNVTVFAARKGVLVKLPSLSRSDPDDVAAFTGPRGPQDVVSGKAYTGFWRGQSRTPQPGHVLVHPLSLAEIETNAPYQPFHSDRRVVLSVFADKSQPGLGDQLRRKDVTSKSGPQKAVSKPFGGSGRWVFGDDIPTTTLRVTKLRIFDDEDEDTGSVIYRETVKVSSPTVGSDDMDQIVSTTRRRKVKKPHDVPRAGGSDDGKEDGFFEDDCDVLDFATDRV